MASTSVEATVSNKGKAEEPTEPVLQAETVALCNKARGLFVGLSTTLGQWRTKAAEVAPVFMQAFHAYGKDTGKSFVSFVRFLDPSVPSDRDGYRASSAYQTAEHLRSTMLRAEKAEQAAKDAAAKAAAGEGDETGGTVIQMAVVSERVLAQRLVRYLLNAGAAVSDFRRLLVREYRWTEKRADKFLSEAAMAIAAPVVLPTQAPVPVAKQLAAKLAKARKSA